MLLEVALISRAEVFRELTAHGDPSQLLQAGSQPRASVLEKENLIHIKGKGANNP